MSILSPRPFASTTAALVQTQIPQGTGSKIGDMTGEDGLNASWDGDTTETTTNCSASTSTAVGDEPWYIGKNWGAGNDKKISGFKCWGSSDQGYKTSSNSNMILKLIGHTSNSPGSGTELASVSFADGNGKQVTKLTGIDVSTAYQYHWLSIEESDGVGNKHKWIGEVQFFEDI